MIIKKVKGLTSGAIAKCNKCNKDIFPFSVIDFDDTGKYICEECNNKIKNDFKKKNGCNRCDIIQYLKTDTEQINSLT